MSPTATQESVSTVAVMAALKAYCFPGGESAARNIRGIRAVQRGEIRSSPEARWNTFVANEFVDATKTRVLLGGPLALGVFSRAGHRRLRGGEGRLVVEKGPLQLKKLTGPDVDRGRVATLPGYVGYCPPMVLNNPSLEFAVVGDRTLKVRDRHDRPVRRSRSARRGWTSGRHSRRASDDRRQARDSNGVVRDRQRPAGMGRAAGVAPHGSGVAPGGRPVHLLVRIDLTSFTALR